MRNITIGILIASGCSFAMPGPAARPYQTLPSCETSATKPVVDLLGAAVMFSAGTVFGLADAFEEDGADGGRELRPYAVGAFAAGGLFTIASIDGFGKASRCRSARAGIDEDADDRGGLEP